MQHICFFHVIWQSYNGNFFISIHRELSHSFLTFVKYCLHGLLHFIYVVLYCSLRSSLVRMKIAPHSSIVLLLIIKGGVVVKNLPVSVGSSRDTGLILDWENPLEQEMAIFSNTLDRGAWCAVVHGVAKSPLQLSPHVCVHAHTHTHDEDSTTFFCCYGFNCYFKKPRGSQ